MKRARPLQISRSYRDAGSWWRFAPAIALAGGLHFVLIFPERFGWQRERFAPAGEPGHVATQLFAERGALARAFEKLLRAETPVAEPAEPRVEPEPLPPSPAIAASAAVPPQPAEREPETNPKSVPEVEPVPDHTERREIEGEPGDAPPDREAPAAPITPLKPHETSAPPPQPMSETEAQRDSLRSALRRIDSNGGHLAAAHRRFEEQAASQRASARGGAAGSDLGLPQLYVYAVPEGAAFVSYLELFGGEVFAHCGGERFVHFARAGERFEARSIARRELDRLAVERGLNLGYVHSLDDVMARLPAPLTSAFENERRQAGAETGGWRVFALGTTREQAAVAAAAQEHLRHHRDEAPRSRLWAELERIEFRYLVDSSDRVYGVRIDAVHDAP